MPSSSSLKGRDRNGWRHSDLPSIKLEELDNCDNKGKEKQPEKQWSHILTKSSFFVGVVAKCSL
jgi:hypothetical protein